MLQKKYLSDGKVEVTFRMPPLDGVVELYLSGEFNNWQANAVPMLQETDGEWAATLVLDAGRTYRFRYHDNQGSWRNDGEADGYVANDYGSDDSLLDLTDPPKQKRRADPGPLGARKAATAAGKKKTARTARFTR